MANCQILSISRTSAWRHDCALRDLVVLFPDLPGTGARLLAGWAARVPRPPESVLNTVGAEAQQAARSTSVTCCALSQSIGELSERMLGEPRLPAVHEENPCPVPRPLKPSRCPPPTCLPRLSVFPCILSGSDSSSVQHSARNIVRRKPIRGCCGFTIAVSNVNRAKSCTSQRNSAQNGAVCQLIAARFLQE